VLTILITYFFLQNIPLPPLSVLSKYFFFSQNFHSVHPTFFPEVWSLAVEEWFYLVVPLLFYFSLRFFKHERKVIFLFWILGIIVLVNLYKIYRIQVYNINDFLSWGNIIAKQVLTRLDSIMIGVLGAYMFMYHQKPWNTYKTQLFYAGIVLILYPQIHQIVFPNDSIFRNYFSLLSISFGTLFLLPQLSSIHTSKGKIYQFFTHISAISYSLYLVHFTIVQWILLPLVMKQLPFIFSQNVHILVQYSLYWIFSLVLSYILYRFFEKPVLNIREKVFS
jgi:peptidoglycan/LPS O-acetylase OafA/YrhL